MPVKTKVESINIDYSLITSETFSVGAQRKEFASRATEIIDQVKSQNAKVLGRVPTHTISVDGREGAPISTVRIPGGVVFVEFELAFEAITWIGEMLRQHSPVKSGEYRQSHVLLADGVAVAPGAVPPIADKYVWVNVTPYARKIERGLSSKAPTGVYQAIATLAASKQKFGNIARIKFGYETPMFGAIDKWAGSSSGSALAKSKSGRRKELHGEWLRRQPAIIITMPGK
jgi:hypothetical protein